MLICPIYYASSSRTLELVGWRFLDGQTELPTTGFDFVSCTSGLIHPLMLSFIHCVRALSNFGASETTPSRVLYVGGIIYTRRLHTYLPWSDLALPHAVQSDWLRQHAIVENVLKSALAI